MKLCIAIILAVYAFSLLSAGQVQAATLGVHTVSKHASNNFERTYNDGSTKMLPYNNENFGAYVVTDSGVVAGGYRNSYDRNTFYAGYSINGPKFGPVQTGLSAVLATGYENVVHVGKLRPLILPHLVLDTPLGFAVRYSVGPGKGGAFQHLSFEVKL